MHAEAIPKRRTTLVLLAVATAIGGLGLAAGGSAGALLAEEMTGSATWAGMPLGVLVLGSAAGALVISRQTSRAGRRAGLVLGYGVGVAGAVMVVAATEIDEFVLLLSHDASCAAGCAARGSPSPSSARATS
jgi:MFS family permease